MRQTGPLDNMQRLLSMQFSLAMISAEAAAIITMRMMGIAGFWPVPKGKNTPLMQEKRRAQARAGVAASATRAGKSPSQITDAAVNPIRKTTRSNVSRLVHRGPKTL